MQQALYEGQPVVVLAAMENAVVVQRDSGAQFTVLLGDRKLTVVELPDSVQAK